MIDINMPAYPDHKPCLLPSQMVIDARYSSANYKALSGLAKILKVHNSYADNFLEFFELYDELKVVFPSARDVLPEFGYSPYNLMLILNSLNLHKEEFAELIHCSFSKVLANTTHRHNAYFRPMVGTQWQDLIACYCEMVKESDNHYNLNHQADSLFFMRADNSLPLNIPASTN